MVETLDTYDQTVASPLSLKRWPDKVFPPWFSWQSDSSSFSDAGPLYHRFHHLIDTVNPKRLLFVPVGVVSSPMVDR